MFILLLTVIAAVIVVIDRLVKNWAVADLMPVGTMDFIKIGDFKILDLTYVENRGAIFGSMAGQRWFLIGFTMLTIIAGIAAMIYFAKRSKFVSFTIMLFVSGGIGNLIDRVKLGYVVDMFDIQLFRFAVFNVADIAVTVAIFLLLGYEVIQTVKEEKAKKAKKAAENE